MTRINIIAPNDLTNQHLFAEFRELPRVFTAVKKLYDNGKTLNDVAGIPASYVLGNGHVKFFYARLTWLRNRFIELADECIKRNINIDMEKYQSILDSSKVLLSTYDIPDNVYVPTPEEKYMNMYRIACRQFKTDDVLFESKASQAYRDKNKPKRDLDHIILH